MGLFHSIKKNWDLIIYLTKNDLKKRFAGSYLGIFWAFIQPAITILLYWFVFQIGLKSTDQGGHTFIVWLMCGLIPWFFFSDAISNATNCFAEYAYLVKKVVFDIEILPLIKILVALIIHVFFVFLLFIVLIFYGYLPSLATLQIIYYTICMFVLSFGLSYLTSSLNVFFKDLSQLVGVALQVGMWMTPILWNYTMISGNHPVISFILKLNPMLYVVEGYRAALLDGEWFFQSMELTVYFWVFSLACLLIGIRMFHKLRPHFADSL